MNPGDAYFIREIEKLYGRPAYRKKFGHAISIKKLGSGAWNLNYLVETAELKSVFRIYSAHREDPFFTNSPTEEWKMLNHIENLEIAPKPLFFIKSLGKNKNKAMAYKFVEGGMRKFTSEMLSIIGKNVAKLHSLDAKKAGFVRKRNDSLAGLKRTIDLQLAGFGNKHKEDKMYAEFSEFYRNIESVRDSQYMEVILHMDLVPSNIVQNWGNHYAKFIDWQSPRVGDAAFDVWSFASEEYQHWDFDEGLNPKQRQIFCDSYIENGGDEGAIERAETKAPYYSVSIGLYCLKRHFDILGGEFNPLVNREKLLRKNKRLADFCLETLKKN